MERLRRQSVAACRQNVYCSKRQYMRYSDFMELWHSRVIGDNEPLCSHRICTTSTSWTTNNVLPIKTHPKKGSGQTGIRMEGRTQKPAKISYLADWTVSHSVLSWVTSDFLADDFSIFHDEYSQVRRAFLSIRPESTTTTTIRIRITDEATQVEILIMKLLIHILSVCVLVFLSIACHYFVWHFVLPC